MIFCHTYISQVFFLPGRKRFLFCFRCFAAAAAAAKQLQSYLTLCDPIDGSPPGSRPWDSPGKNTGVGFVVLTQFYINNNYIYIYIVLDIKALNFRTRKTLRIQSVFIDEQQKPRENGPNSNRAKGSSNAQCPVLFLLCCIDSYIIQEGSGPYSDFT